MIYVHCDVGQISIITLSCHRQSERRILCPMRLNKLLLSASFKRLLNRNLIQPPKYFNSGCCIGQILHARLRLRCSSLNSDLYRKIIVNNASCTCGGFESTYNFFYMCPRYTHLRNACFADELLRLNVNQMFFGVIDATIQENELLFYKVQDFILLLLSFLLPLFQEEQLSVPGESMCTKYWLTA